MPKRESLEEAIRGCSRPQPHQGDGDLRVARPVLFGDGPADHGDFIAIVQEWAAQAILVNLIGKLLAPGHSEAHMLEKFGNAREQTHAGYAVPSGLIDTRFHQLASRAKPFAGRCDGDGAD